MNKAGILLTALIISTVLITSAIAATDGVYTLSEATFSWDGTDADRFKATSPDYDYDYGDETSLTYTMPWEFAYYGQGYTQITVDTNGNVWFGYAGSAYSFNLSNAGKGPVIANWNNDLSSLFYGGVFIQHKTNPERVVIEWQTETFSDQGTSNLNNFEVVLFPDGSIRTDYKTFNGINNNDSGSGISEDDGIHFLSITANYNPVYTLAGHSFSSIGPIPVLRTLNVLFSGSGGGIVTSTPAGIACNTDCSYQFLADTPVTLHSAASQYSLFTGWTNGACNGTGDCLLTLSADSSITAAFGYNSVYQVYLPGGNPLYYLTIQAAYNNAATGSDIKTWATDYNGAVNCNRSVDVTLQGGYDSGYVNQVGTTVIHGALNISQGKVIVNGVTVRNSP